MLLLDDLGLESSTDAVKANLTLLLDRRAETGKPTIITTNLTDIPAMYARYHDRIMDRLKVFEPHFVSLPSKR